MNLQEPPPQRTINRWLARFSFSLFIISGWLLYESYKLVMIVRHDGIAPPMGRISLYVIAALMSLALGAAGVRERHRRQF